MMDRDAIIRGLREAGVPPDMAARRADDFIAEQARRLEPSPFARGGNPNPPPLTVIDPWRDPAPMTEVTKRGALIRWPFRLTLPWSHLVSDNRKYAPALRGGKPAMILTVGYRAAKRLAAIVARTAWGDGVPYADGLLELTARVYFPNDYRRRDAHNFQKCAHDALSGIVYADDSQLVPRWIPAGVDVDAPRAEMTFHPFPPV
jgi:hypothetical protein